MAVLANRVAVATATTGTGTVTLGAVLSNAFCTFAEAGVADAAVVTYLITEGDDFELGRGTYTAAGTTLTRDTVLLSKIAGTAGTAKMTLAGAAEVRVAMAAEDPVMTAGAQTVGGDKTFSGLTDFTTAPTVGGTNPVMHVGKGLADHQYTIADDTAITVTLPANCGSNFILAIANGTSTLSGALLWVGITTNVLRMMAQGQNNYDILQNTALTGTSGTDGKVTLSVNGNTLYIENRWGSTQTFVLSFLANR